MPSVVVNPANVTKLPVIALWAVPVVIVTIPLPAPPVVLTGLEARLKVALIGVISLKTPAFSKYAFFSVPINNKFSEANVTKSNILRGVPIY